MVSFEGPKPCVKGLSPDVATSGELYRAYERGVHGFRQIHRSRSVFACVALSADFVWKVTVDNAQAEPRIGERVPYVLVYGKPHERLMALIRQPQEVLGDLTLKPHGFYYCSRQLVPVLNRILLLLGLDTGKWLLQVQKRLLNVQKDSSLASLYGDVVYYRRFVAQVFGGTDHSDLLFDLGGRRQDSWAVQQELMTQYGHFERQQYQLKQICGACMGKETSVVECQSFDCPVLSQHYKVLSRSARLLALQQQLMHQRPDLGLADHRDEQQEDDWLMEE